MEVVKHWTKRQIHLLAIGSFHYIIIKHPLHALNAQITNTRDGGILTNSNIRVSSKY